jgi:hypothetical protein
MSLPNWDTTKARARADQMESDRAEPRYPGFACCSTAAFRDRSPGFSCNVLPVNLGDPAARDRFLQDLIPVTLA